MPRQSDLRFTFQPQGGSEFEVIEFEFKEGLSRPFKLELKLSSSNAAITRYYVEVEPLLARAGLRSNWRIFQQKTVPEILASLIKAQGITDVESNLQRDHQPREYCVQAGETDLDFFARLAASEMAAVGADVLE